MQIYRIKILPTRLTTDLGVISDSDTTDRVVSLGSDFASTSCTVTEQHKCTNISQVSASEQIVD